jgi:hypothetical protein
MGQAVKAGRGGEPQSTSWGAPRARPRRRPRPSSSIPSPDSADAERRRRAVGRRGPHGCESAPLRIAVSARRTSRTRDEDDHSGGGREAEAWGTARRAGAGGRCHGLSQEGPESGAMTRGQHGGFVLPRGHRPRTGSPAAASASARGGQAWTAASGASAPRGPSRVAPRRPRRTRASCPDRCEVRVPAPLRATCLLPQDAADCKGKHAGSQHCP